VTPDAFPPRSINSIRSLDSHQIESALRRDYLELTYQDLLPLLSGTFLRWPGLNMTELSQLFTRRRVANRARVAVIFQ
jgi:hypothetical protein